MSNEDNGGPAFPFSSLEPEGPSVYKDNEGMSLRDYFAAKAMQSLILNPSSLNGDGWDHITAGAYQLADAMLAERAK